MGWALSNKPDAELVIKALDMAYEQRGRPQGLLFHSDQGSQGRFNCVTTCKTVSRVRFTMLMAVRLLGLDKLPLKAEINHIAVTVNGSMAGRPNRLPTGYRSIFRTMNPCASLTKPYIRRSTFRVEVLSSAN